MTTTDRERREVVGANIRRARELAGMSQGQLARQLGLDRGRLSDWERGRYEPDWDRLDTIAKALGQPRSFFYED